MDFLKNIPTEVKPVLVAQIVGGSNLYGLNTPTSDVDYRLIYKATNPAYIYGLREPNVYDGVTDEIDYVAYELRHFMRLLLKSNTQSAEMLFAPDESFTFKDHTMDLMRDFKMQLLDSETLFKSLKGYLHNERRLTLGERTGQLGGKRKASIDERGFSHKNAVQFIRLCQVGAGLFLNGEYVVNMKEHELYPLLMEIKSQPDNFTKEQLEKFLDENEKVLYDAYDNKKIQTKFNMDLAASLLRSAYV